MLNRGMSKSEVEKDLSNKGDFVQIDHLTAFLKEDISTDIKKWAMVKMAEIYEKKFMFRQAAKIYNNLAMICITFADKIKNHVKEAELYIKAADLKEADHACQKAMSQANTFEKNDIMASMRQFYKKQAEAYEKELRRNNAAKMYEKLLEISQTTAEKSQVKNKLMELYQKLGKFREYNAMKSKE